jgi:hypothetical protein
MDNETNDDRERLLTGDRTSGENGSPYSYERVTTRQCGAGEAHSLKSLRRDLGFPRSHPKQENLST